MPIITATGPEVQVNTTFPSNQIQPTITHLSGGRFIVVWIDSTIALTLDPNLYINADIKARIFNANGTPATGEFVVNTTIANAQLSPDVIELSDGHILIGWQDRVELSASPPSSTPSTFFAREFDANGLPLTNEFIIGGAASGAVDPSLAPLAGGGFVATWQTEITRPGVPFSSGPVTAEIYNADNQIVGSRITVDNTALSNSPRPQVITLDNGNFVVSWSGNNTNGVTSLGSFRIYSPTGAPISAEIPIDPNLPFFGRVRGPIALTNGGFAIPFDFRTTTGRELHFQIYLADGTFVVDQTITILPTGGVSSAVLVPLADGGLAATWSSGVFSAENVNMQIFNGIGDPQGSPFIVNATTTGDQITPDLAMLENGDLVVTWIDNSGTGSDTSGYGIRAQVFDVVYTNAPPVAVDDSFQLPSDLSQSISTDEILNNDTDGDGDLLIVTDITNVVGGTVTLDAANQTFTVTRAPGATGGISFDYTVSDGQGGTDIGHVNAQPNPNDNITVRGATPVGINILANDGLVARPDGYAVTTPPGTGLFLTGTGISTSAFFASIASPSFFNYLTLPVGQTLQQFISYTVTNPVTGIVDYTATIAVTLQGWTQNGGTGSANLVGGNEADHLIGGLGAPKTLTGGGGDDWYTVSVAGDQVIELTNGGNDRVLSALTTFVLPDNVEELQPWNVATLDGTGNALNNLLIGSNGNDILSGLGGADNINGGNGLDTAGYRLNTGGVYVDLGANYADESAQTSSTYDLAAAIVSRDRLTLIENATGSAFGDRIYGTATDNVIGGGDGNDILYGNDGIDTIDFSSNMGAVFVDIAASTAIESALTTGTINAATAQTSFDYLISFENANGSAFGDRIYGTSGANIINGSGGDDILYGLEGRDTLSGGEGADVLVGGDGVDIMTGGAGADRFFFSTAAEANAGPPEPVDRITDFATGVDQLWVNRAAFGLTAASTIDVLIGGPNTANATFYNNSGNLFFDTDGTGAGAAQWVANVGNFGVGDVVLYG